MKFLIKYTILSPILIFLLVIATFGQSVDDLDKQAEEFFKKKLFNQAIKLWLDALNIEPDNEKIQKKIEIIYEIKQKKDISILRSKIHYKIARKYLRKDFTEEDFQNGKRSANKSFRNYITAYRLDPKDPEIRGLMEDMKRLEADLRAAEEKQRLSLALKAKVKKLKLMAREAMNPTKKGVKEDYKSALKFWEEILDLVPKDKEAKEGKRKCKLAIENRIKFEKIRNFMNAGKKYFKNKKYNLAKLEFKQVLQIDEKNSDAKDFIEKIDDKLADARLKMRRRQQAEDFYVSALKNIRENKFNQAQEDLESCLALIPNYKDAKQRLSSLDRLRAEYKKRQFALRLKRINASFQVGMIAYSQDRFQEAIQAFNKTLTLDPANKLAKEFIKKAQEAYQEKRENIVDENSPYYTIINSLIMSGKSLFKKGDYVNSKKKWDRILELFPKNKIAKTYQVKCILKLNPSMAKSYIAKIYKDGKNYEKKKNYKKALQMYEEVKELSPDYPNIDKQIAKLKVTQKTAVSSSNVSGVSRAEINRRYNLAMVFYRRGGASNYQNALAQLQWIVRRDPGNVRAIISLNKISTQLKSPSRVQVTRTSRLTPRQRRLIKLYYYRGINYYSNNDFRRAILQWRKVLAIDPTHVKARNNIRKCLVFLGR